VLRAKGVDMSFNYIGGLEGSKSIVNRALIAKSFYSKLKLNYVSSCDDVILMAKAESEVRKYTLAKDIPSNNKVHTRWGDCEISEKISEKNEEGTELAHSSLKFDKIVSSNDQEIATSVFQGINVFAGHAGTVLRFMAFRLSREKGTHTIWGSERLFERPQKILQQSLFQLGIESKIYKDHMVIHSQGWKLMGNGVHIPSHVSSQFASGVLLSCWDLNFELRVQLEGRINSLGYLNLTVELLRRLGMKIFWSSDKRELIVPAGQVCKSTEFICEMDLSSAFSLSSVAIFGGAIRLTSFPDNSLQPDKVFTSILAEMGVDISIESNVLSVNRSNVLKPISINLTNCPDLFPSLAMICAYANGESHLYGAEHLHFKESNRIEKMSELIQCLGRKTKILKDGIKIYGKNFTGKKVKAFNFDTDKDHRLAMAASIALKLGASIKISQPEVVNKSFPDFWDIIGEKV